MSSTNESASAGQSVREVAAINVRRAREKSGMTVTALAHNAGCTPDLIEDVEQGRIPEADLVAHLQHIAIALQTDVEELLKRGTDA